MGAQGYDRFSLTARAKDGEVLVAAGYDKTIIMTPNDARRAALGLREAADRAESPAFNPAKAKGNEPLEADS